MDTKQFTGQQRYEQLSSKRSSLLALCEEYARWTLPYIHPPSGAKGTELQGPKASIGAQGVNHLANKLIMTLFRPSQPFFRLLVSTEITDELNAAAKRGDKAAIRDLALIDQQLAAKEKAAMVQLDYNRFRTEATTAAKHLLITGNALMYSPDGGGSTQVYGLRNYCVVRDLSGAVIELITLDQKAFGTFSEDVQKQIQADDRNSRKFETDTNVDLYTWVKLDKDGRYSMTQWAGNTKLDSSGTWPKDELPWLVLTWNLCRGEDYGRGLVEDYAGAFHALDILTEAYVTLVAIAADIKFLVDPSSVTDPDAINKSASGTYHSGKKDDVTVVQLDKLQDAQTVISAIQAYQQTIGQAFLLASAIRRDAERVTAEEIRSDINELDTAHGGIYSRFSEDWQLPLAILQLKRIGLNLGKSGEIKPQIITGLDSLSRAGDLDNLRLFVSDLAMLEAVPEEFRQAIDPIAFAEFIGIRRGVDYGKFVKSVQTMQAEQQAATAAQEQQIMTQAGADMASAAGKQMIAGETS